MTSPTIPVFGSPTHPAGQILVSAPRKVASRASALGGYRLDTLQCVTPVSRAHVGVMDVYEGSR